MVANGSKNGRKAIILKNRKNIEAFEKFVPYIKAKSKKNPQDNIYGYARTLAYLEQSVKGKDFSKLTDKDILNWMAELEAKGLKQNSTIKVYCNRVSAFLKWLNDGEVPKDIRNIMPRGTAASTSKKRPITYDDAIALAKATLNPRDACLIMLYWDTGARLNELRTIKLGDILHDEYGATLEITNEKIAGTRKTRISDGVFLDLASWLNYHPDKRKSRDSYLFCPLDDPSRAIGEDNIIRILRTAAKKSGFGHIHSHLFRHSKATRLAEQGYSQYDLENLLGWKRGSPMAATYVHGFDSTKKQLVKMGKLEEGEDFTEKPKLQSCPWKDCKAMNTMTASFCLKCHRQLDAKIAEEGYNQSIETMQKSVEGVVSAALASVISTQEKERQEQAAAMKKLQEELAELKRGK